MYVTRVSFAFEPAASQTELPSAEVVDALLGAWRMNGQISGRVWPIYKEGNGYTAIVLTPERNSLGPGFNCVYVTLPSMNVCCPEHQVIKLRVVA